MANLVLSSCSAIRTVRSFAGEALERERFSEHVDASYRSGIGFAAAKATLESLNRCDSHHLPLMEPTATLSPAINPALHPRFTDRKPLRSPVINVLSVIAWSETIKT